MKYEGKSLKEKITEKLLNHSAQEIKGGAVGEETLWKREEREKRQVRAERYNRKSSPQKFRWMEA